MTLDQLNEFCALVQFRNFHRAAEYLYLNQSTLSRHIADLENSLGTQLLVRDNKILRLTEAGQILYESALGIIRDITSLEGRIQEAKSGKLGKLTVSSIYVYHEVLYTSYRLMCRDYPEVHFSLFCVSSEDVLKAVLQDEADAGVLFSCDLPLNCEGLDGISIDHEYFCVVVPENSPLAGQTSIRLTQLRGEHLLLVDHAANCLTKAMLQQHTDGPAPQRTAASAENLESIMLQIKAGIGVSVLPKSVAKEHQRGCCLLDIADFDSGYDLIMIWKKSNKNRTLEQLCNLLRKLL